MSPSPRSPITTHVLDLSKGYPAQGLSVKLELRTSETSWSEIARGLTQEDGRISDLLPRQGDSSLSPGIYRMVFDTGSYFAMNQIEGFYPLVQVVFEIKDSRQHYHIPLLLSPYGYSTYRGS